MNILHGLTGSIAATLYPKIKNAYINNNVKFVATNSACAIEVLQEPNLIYKDYDEWLVYHKEQKVLHIDLVKWADVFIIAPCSANTLAKIANGICDNLLTCCAKAWISNKQFIIAPSMNTQMWFHPTTQEHINKIKNWGIIDIVYPVEKTLFCGDTGIGAMADIYEITDQIIRPSSTNS